MNRKESLSLALLLTSSIFAACSGKPGGVVCPPAGCVVGGNGSVLVTVTSTPSQTFFFPSLEWAISSVQLLNSGTGATIVAGALPPVDFARLQTDSQLLGKALSPVPAGAYTSAKIQLAPSTAASYFYNSSNATLLGCAPATVCQIPNTVVGFGQTTVTVPVNFTVIANSNVGFSLNFDLSKAVTSTGGMTFDFTKSGAITLSTLPRQGQSSGSLDSLQNFTGNVTAVTGTTSISMASLSSDTRTFTMAATVEFDDPFGICTPPASFSCIAVNQNLSVDAVINSDGTLTAYEVEFLDKFAQETEGIIVTPVTNNQFKMVVTNGMGTTFLPGTLATVNVNGTSTYFLDPKNLGITNITAPLGFASSTDLVMGQAVMLLGGSANFTNNSLSGYTRTLLRYSSIGGTIQTPNGTIFTLSGVSPFFTNLVTNSVQVQTFANTTYDNITGGFSGLAIGTNASVRGLYLNPTSGATQPLLAAKVRAH